MDECVGNLFIFIQEWLRYNFDGGKEYDLKKLPG